MPSRTAGLAPATRDAAPALTDQGEALLRRWCTAVGRGEDFDALITHLEAKKVRSLERYTARWAEDDLHAHLDVAVAVAEQTARRRGDLIRLRGQRRHPWRTSTSQSLGGAVG